MNDTSRHCPGCVCEAKIEGVEDPLGEYCLELEGALELILPLAKGYAAANPVGSNAAYVAEAEAVLHDKPPEAATRNDRATLERAIVYCKGQTMFFTDDRPEYDKGVEACVRMLEDMLPMEPKPASDATYTDGLEAAMRAIQSLGIDGRSASDAYEAVYKLWRSY